MDTPKIENRTYKKVVPLKGRLLDKLKNEFKKELSKNDSKAAENGVNDTINNNIQTNELPVAENPLQSPDKKIIIQKVENVQIEAIQTTSKGPIRRISSFFDPESEFQEVDIMPVTNTPRTNVSMCPEIDEISVANGEMKTQVPIKLLSAKIPENIFNKKVPLKVVRIIKQPKLKPNLNQRFYRVETFKIPERTAVEEQVYDFAETDVDPLAFFPDIEMKDNQATAVDVEPNDRIIFQVADSNSIAPLIPRDQSSGSKEDFKGFDQESIESHRYILKSLQTWKRALTFEQSIEPPADNDSKLHRNESKIKEVELTAQIILPDENYKSLIESPAILESIKSTEVMKKAGSEPKARSLKTKPQPRLTNRRSTKSQLKLPLNGSGEASTTNPDCSSGIIMPSSKPISKNPTISSIENPQSNNVDVKVSPKYISESSSFLKLSPNSTSPKIVPCPEENPPVTEIRDIVSTTAYIEQSFPVKPLVKPVQTASENQLETSTEVIAMNSAQTVQSKTIKDFPIPSTSKGVTKHESKSSNASKHSAWQDDIHIVIGTNRLKEIDEMLKKIPNLVTGSPIETENVELRLIIRHLLRHFKMKSILETVGNAASLRNEDSSNNDDDDFPDSYGEHSNGSTHFFGPSTEDSPNTSSCEDDNEKDSTHDPTVGGPSDLLAIISEQSISETTNTQLLSAPVQTVESIEKEVDLMGKDQSESITTTKKRKISTPSPEISDSKKSKIRKSSRFLTDGKERLKSLRSSSRDASVEPAIQNLPEKLLTTKTRSRRQLIDGTERRNSLRSSSCDSDSKGKKLPSLAPVLQNFSSDSYPEQTKPVSLQRHSKLKNSGSESVENVRHRRTSRVQELKDSESDSGPSRMRRKSTRLRKIQSSSDNTDMDRLKDNKSLSSDGSDRMPIALTRRSEMKRKPKGREAPLKNDKKQTISKLLETSSDSEFPDDTHENISRNMELKSRLCPNDSNSIPKHSVFIRNDYLKSTDKRQKKNAMGLGFMMDKLSTTIEQKKRNDNTYVEPPVFETRERLKTSAFKGKSDDRSNDDNIQSESEPDTKPSVSRGSSVENSPPKRNSESQIKKRGRRRTKGVVDELAGIEKRIFAQPPLEDAIEDQVPYNQILEAIKSCLPSKIGRASLKVSKEHEEKREKDFKALKALKFFRCGSCKFEVTKHKWIDHHNDHGGLAWVDGLEAAINIMDWNEALRRVLRNMKIYDQTTMTCPNCQEEKKSALGHLSHYYVCGETKEAIEKKKIPCGLCNEKYLPFYASLHRTKCSAIEKVREVSDGDDEGGSTDSDNELAPESFNLSGRRKRKAVKRAEKKFKKINEFKPSDHLHVKNGQLRCHICGEEDFQTQEEALNHIKKEHDNEGDFLDSGSDVEMGEDESSDETEGSSGDNSDEIRSVDEENSSANDEFVSSNKKARPSATESQEVKNGRAVIMEFTEELRDNLATKIFKWTKQFIDENWKTEFFPQLVPKYNLTSALDPKQTLPLLNYNLKSLKFGIKNVDKYTSTYENPYNKEWKQLEIGESESDKQSATIYCGGSVSAIDWAPSEGNLDFLAVATNSTNKGIKMNLNESTKSCVQLYEFKGLTNEKFQGFNDTSKLCYVIIINNGPVWSIKFHPNESSIENRVGLLAVATANQNILVYSMPYLNNDKPIVLQIEPHLVCKLEEDDVLFNDEFLLQASKVAWFQKTDLSCVLAAGYISGTVGVWNIGNHDNFSDLNQTLYPQHVLQTHMESITALDFKATSGPEFHLLTTSLDRKVKVFTFDEISYQEISNQYSNSRVLCAEWWLHWPGFLMGFDDCFTASSFIYRQPLEFGMRNSSLFNTNFSINHLSINNWLNFAMFVTDSGDVIGCSSRQMLQHSPKDKWSYFNFSVYSSTDFNKITTADVDEIRIIFNDFKSKTSQPKKQRIPPTDRINELQINQVCFNRNEKSYRFYALGYETGFIRIRYLKNLK